MSEIVEVELEELERPSSPLGGDTVPLVGAEQRPVMDSFHEEQSKRNQPRTSIITRQPTSQQQPGYTHLVENETIIREKDERTKTTYTSIVQRGPGLDVQLVDQVKQQDSDVPTPKDNLTKEKQAELRMLDETEATGEYYTERLNTEQMEREENTLFFEEIDEDTNHTHSYRIDYVLVYKDSEEEESGCLSSLMRCLERREKAQNIAMSRSIFLDRARKLGLKVKEQPKEKSEDKKTTFVWVHCPWELLLKGAEDIGLKKPINDKLLPLDMPWHQKLIETRTQFRSPLAPVIPEDLEVQPYLAAPFKKDFRDRFIECDVHNQDKFFTTGERAMIVHNILDNLNYSTSEPQDDTMFGLERALGLGLFKAAYPLHDGSHQTKSDGIVHSERQLLYREWTHWKAWYKTQPIHHIRRYFGIKIGLYFAFLGHLTSWLLFASILGAGVMIYGISTLTTGRNPIAADACQVPIAKYVNSSEGLVPPPNTTFYMCPPCDINCDFWYYQNSCLSSRFSLLFDNGGTVFLAAFMSIWAVLFLEFWKRKQYRLQHEWDVLEYELVDETPRSQFLQEMKKQFRKDPLTQEDIIPPRLLRYNHIFDKYELVQPQHRFILKLMAAFSGLLFMATLVVGIVFAILVYRAAIALVLYIPLARIAGTYTGTGVNLFVLITAALIQLLVIMVMNVVYKIIAVWLNNWELHRTQSAFEDSLILKLYIFQFFNYYTSIFYIAFFKGNVVGFPGNYHRIGAIRLEECSTYGCFLELTIQLVIILGGKQILYQTMELGIPLLKWILNLTKNYFRRDREKDPVYARWERDYDLSPQPKFGLLPEYLELAVQYGFVTLFVASFPLAPLFAFVNNIFEVRLDAYKYVVATRRPVPKRAEDIGAWYGIFNVVATLAVVTNASLIAFSSDVIPQLVYKYSHFSSKSCSEYHWPSCDLGQEFAGLGGYLNFQLRQFTIKDLFDEVRGCSLDNVNSTCRGEIVPRIDVYNLRAVNQSVTQDGGVVTTDLDYLFLPFLNLTCLNSRITNETRSLVLDMNRRDEDLEFVDSLRYTDFTPEVAGIPGIYEQVPHCINNSTTCSFNGFGNTGPEGRIPYEYSLIIIGKLAFVIVFEHVIFVLVAVIAAVIPDVPKRVKDEIKREKLLAQTAKVTVIQTNSSTEPTTQQQ